MNTIDFIHPAPQSVPVDEDDPHQYPPPAQIKPPAAKYTGSDYLDGSTASLAGANPGRDQDRSRVDECTPASYHYNSRASGTEGENETGVVEGY